MKNKTILLLSLFLLFLSACGYTQDTTENTAETTVVSQYAPGKREITTPAPFDPLTIPTHETPKSTCFSRIGYNAEHQILLVQFRDSGRYYSYGEVSPELYDRFSSAESLGGFYNQYIKGHYDSIRYDEE